MDAELKAKWVEGLRSGRYEQATGTLRTDAGAMCCLAVLCDVEDPEKWTRESANYWKWDGHDACLSIPHMVRTGITTKQHANLMDMNDNHGVKFPEIADYIEQNL